jgi:hypothetical protein
VVLACRGVRRARERLGRAAPLGVGAASASPRHPFENEGGGHDDLKTGMSATLLLLNRQHGRVGRSCHLLRGRPERIFEAPSMAQPAPASCRCGLRSASLADAAPLRHAAIDVLTEQAERE